MTTLAFVALLCTFIYAKSESVDSVPTGPFLRYSDLGGKSYTVSSDNRSWIIDGKRTLLLGGSIHYPRLSPGQWKPILQKMVDDGLNHAEVYVFWNLHEALYDFSGKHVYNYEGRANLPAFLKIAKEVGIFVNLRIGPYVCAEWSFGGLPTWLLHVPGILFRDGNQQWENYMGTFVQEIANISEPYLAKNGGPIILAQIENEYHGSGTSGSDYVKWCGQLVTSLDMNVSWVMCNGESASDTINTCNGNNCYSSYAKGHSKNHPGQPLGWTENEGWFQSWNGGYNPNATSGNNRSPQDMAYVVAIWFAGGAAHHNYYMWYGGNHVSWTAGSGITNFYADGVNLHGDGLNHEPKKTHLMRLHNILSEYGEYPLMESPIQIGHEIPLTSNNGLYLEVENCQNNDKNQQWSYDSSTKQLKATAFGNANCVVSTGKSDPVATMQCDTSNKHQQWTYLNEEFKSTDNSCLDIFGEHGPNVDEWECKSSSSSDAANQKWTISGNQIKSALNGQCLTVGTSVTSSAFAYEYHSTTKNTNITFLCNTGGAVTVTWKGKKYNLAGTSVQILDNDNSLLYDTSVVNETGLATKRTYTTIYSGSKDLSFSSWSEILPLYLNSQKRPDKATLNKTPMEQIRFTNDTSEYLYYSTNFTASSSMNGVTVQIDGRKANAYIIYIDNMYVGETWDGEHSMGTKTYSIKANSSISSGKHTITIISSSLGIHNGIANQQPSSAQDMKGIVGKVHIGSMDITNNNWNHWIGRSGEVLNVTGSGMNNVQWKSPIDKSNALTYYKTSFNTPSQADNTNGVILVDIGSRGTGLKRGHWFINGFDMGHYNNVMYNGLMVQQYYFIPNDYLTVNKGLNTLIFAEELSNPMPTNSNIVFSTFVVP